MTLQTRMPAYAILATVALSGGPALGDDSPAPLAGGNRAGGNDSYQRPNTTFASRAPATGAGGGR